MIEYWERLKPEMDAKKMDITALASAMKISFQAVAKVRDGGKFGSLNNIKAANIFGLNPEWLATGKGQKAANTATGGPLPAAVQQALKREQTMGKSLADLFDQLPNDASIRAEVFVKCHQVIRSHGQCTVSVTSHTPDVHPPVETPGV